jgi:CubicO group peptidase (beta-lactamase class C family)
MRLPGVRSFLYAFFVLASLAVATSFAQDKDYGAFVDDLDSLLVPQIVPDGPGAAVAVIQNGQVVYRHCLGLANLEHGVPITRETVFNLASVAKQFTALGVLLLEQEGTLKLDDDIHRYFPELPAYDVPVTLHNLMHHTSGLWEYSTMFRYYGGRNPVDYTSIEDVLALLKEQDQLLFTPGSQFKYCNTNYALLGELVARVTGESLASWTKRNIFEPLKMKNTFFREDCNTVIPHGASCYYKTGGVFKSDLSNSEVIGEGYLFSTIDDIVLWLDNFRLHTVGGDSLITRMFQKSTLSDGNESLYGYGLRVEERDGKRIVSHSGQTGSFNAMMIYVPEDEFGIAVLANSGHIRAEPLAYSILNLFYGVEEKQKEVAQAAEAEPFVSLDSVSMDYLEGAYLIDEVGGKLFLCRLGNWFYGIMDNYGSDFFRPVSESLLINNLHNALIHIQDESGRKAGRVMLDLRKSGNVLWASRIDQPEISQVQLANDYAGTYYSEALGTAYRISVEDGRLTIRHPRYADRSLQPTDMDEFVGSIGIVRFSRNEQGLVESFAVTDEDTNFKPLIFRRIP